MKYAIKVPFDDDYLFVTKEGPQGPEILYYDLLEDAEKQAQLWGEHATVVERPSTDTVTLEEDDNGDLIMPLPEHLLTELGWKPGTNLKWIDNENGTFSLVKDDD